MKKRKKESIDLFNCIIKTVLYILAYGLVLMLVSYLFKSFYISNFFYGLLAAIIIYILNITIKPVIFKLTLPITGLTFGLFYFVINVFILKITDWILGVNFNMTKLFIMFIIAILIAIINALVEELILKPVIRRIKIHE